MWPWEKETQVESKDRDNAANRQYQAKYREGHREEEIEKCRKWREENPGYFTQWNHDNPDKVKEKSLRQNQTEGRKEYMREYMREYRKNKKATEEPKPGKKRGRPRKNPI